MKKIKVAALLGLSILLLSTGILLSSVENPGSELAVTPKGKTVFICKDAPIPPEAVIIYHLRNYDCPGSGYNSWAIKRPGVREYVCKCSPVPAGYVVTAYTGIAVDCPSGRMKIIEQF